MEGEISILRWKTKGDVIFNSKVQLFAKSIHHYLNPEFQNSNSFLSWEYSNEPNFQITLYNKIVCFTENDSQFIASSASSSSTHKMLPYATMWYLWLPAHVEAIKSFIVTIMTNIYVLYDNPRNDSSFEKIFIVLVRFILHFLKMLHWKIYLNILSCMVLISSVFKIY